MRDEIARSSRSFDYHNGPEIVKKFESFHTRIESLANLAQHMSLLDRSYDEAAAEAQKLLDDVLHKYLLDDCFINQLNKAPCASRAEKRYVQLLNI